MQAAAPAGGEEEASRRLKARIAGLVYLLNILTILFAVLLFRRLFVARDPAATERLPPGDGHGRSAMEGAGSRRGDRS